MEYRAEQSPQEVAYAVTAMMAFPRTGSFWPRDKAQQLQGVSSEIVRQAVSKIIEMATRAFSERIAIMPQRQFDWLEFKGYADAWKQSRPKGSSSAMQMAGDPNYLRIINMSERAVPCLLRQLQNELRTGEPDHWFAALWATTNGVNPVPEADRGKMRKMAEAWIEWGGRQGLLDAGMGNGPSKFR